MAAQIGRGMIAYLAAVVVAIVVAIVASSVAGFMECTFDDCVQRLPAMIVGYVLYYGMSGFFFALLAAIPFLGVYLLLKRLKLFNVVTSALCGLAFGFALLGLGIPLADVPQDATGSEVFQANLASRFGIGTLVIGALSGLAVYWVDRRGEAAANV